MQAANHRIHVPDAAKLILYVVAVLVGGALLSPLLVSGGRWLLSLAGGGGDSFLEPLLEEIRKADFSRYFRRASQACAVLFLWPLIRWTGMNRGLFPGWRPVRRGLAGYALGFCLAAGLLLALGCFFCAQGIYRLRPEPAWTGFSEPLSAAFGAGVLEELFFRGALFGLLLRSQRPLAALVTSSVLFAFVHFLTPPEAWKLPLEDVTWSSGFLALGAIFSRFQNTDFLLAEFATLLAVGWVLGAVRLRTGQLWACMGLHGGWVFGLKYFSALTLGSKALRAGEHLPWIGVNLKIGLAPLLVIALTGWLACRLLPRSASDAKK